MKSPEAFSANRVRVEAKLDKSRIVFEQARNASVFAMNYDMKEGDINCNWPGDNVENFEKVVNANEKIKMTYEVGTDFVWETASGKVYWCYALVGLEGRAARTGVNISVKDIDIETRNKSLGEIVEICSKTLKKGVQMPANLKNELVEFLDTSLISSN